MKAHYYTGNFRRGLTFVFCQIKKTLSLAKGSGQGEGILL
jgi:hypothetical protein